MDGADSKALKSIAVQLDAARSRRRGKATKSGLSSANMPAAPPEASSSQAHAALIRELCHELRNPLTVIIGYAERIRDGDRSRSHAKVVSYAQNILEGAQLAMDILRDFSGRLVESAAPSQPPTADVKAAVESCLRLVAPLAKQAGLRLSKSLGKHLPQLMAQDRALKQIMLNVLLNAVRHQKTGGRIAVKARRLRDGRLRIVISDDGIGMTKKEIKAALHGKPAQQPRPGSLSGLGLPLVKRLVEDAGGAITIESARRKGTTVEIRFPPSSLVSPS